MCVFKQPHGPLKIIGTYSFKQSLRAVTQTSLDGGIIQASISKDRIAGDAKAVSK
jgi:hypothetical protein